MMPQNMAVAHISPYVRFDIGHTMSGRLKIKPPSTAQQSLDYESDLLSSAALGADFNNGMRFELEASHHKNGLIRFDQSIDHGDMSADAVMGNLYIDILRNISVHPYVAVGVGAAKIDLTAYDTSGTLNFTATKTVPAYQAMIGVRVPLTQNLSLDAGYRYFAIPASDAAGLGGAGQTAHSFEATQSTSRIGLIYRFGNATKATPPSDKTSESITETPVQARLEPQTHEASLSDFETSTPMGTLAATTVTSDTTMVPEDHSFVIHFAFDKADLDLQAAMEIQAAALDANEGHAKAVNISGHTDTSGSMAYNLILSKRRAMVVVNALVENGVDPTVISFVYRGEADTVVATKDGVPEPRNRRTQIDIRY
jgi:outer membrane protein OmpA-like peptidoglycan-associated protein